ncbi:MAG: hypothetical protein QOG16_551, partial [Actinomycetota bacterium]|nr:hypothetical protein [Actinomycetota bacterium]
MLGFAFRGGRRWGSDRTGRLGRHTLIHHPR